MRDLSSNAKNIMIVHDKVSGSEVELYYRMPRTSERAGYQAKTLVRKGKKTIVNIFDPRMEYGLKVLTGFRAGDFGVDGQPISSDPSAPNYREDWKELLKETAADIVQAFAFVVFEGAKAEDMTGDEDIEIAQPDEEEIPPLGKSSGG